MAWSKCINFTFDTSLLEKYFLSQFAQAAEGFHFSVYMQFSREKQITCKCKITGY